MISSREEFEYPFQFLTPEGRITMIYERLNKLLGIVACFIITASLVISLVAVVFLGKNQELKLEISRIKTQLELIEQEQTYSEKIIDANFKDCRKLWREIDLIKVENSDEIIVEEVE